MKKRVKDPNRKLKPRHYRVGPEGDLGCFNTGHAPCIERTRIISWADGSEVYSVGPVLFRFEAILEWLKQGARKRVLRYKRFNSIYLYRFYKTWRSANAEFLKQCQANLDSVAEEARRAHDLRRRAARGDLDAALKLGFA